MNKYLVSFLCLLLPFSAFSQTILLEEDEAVDTTESNFGVNQKNSIHPFIAAGFTFGEEEEGGEINPLQSYNINLGIRYKRKLSNVFALGADVLFHNSIYNLGQDSTKLLGSMQTHEEEKYSIWTIGAEGFTRINFDPNRGNYMGIFLDLGAGIGYNFTVKHKILDELLTGEQMKLTLTQLDYPLRYRGWAFARFGYNRIALTGSYRLTDLWEEGEVVRYEISPDPDVPRVAHELPELPRIMVGVELSFF